jgi:hypothetical protein
MGYFGFRAAPLGEATAEQVINAFYNFAPSMVERAIPDAWQFATPRALVEARAVSAAAALRRLFEPVERLATNVNDVLRRAGQHESNSPALPLFGANRQIARREDDVEELWQLCTTMREHRGDGHVAALRESHIDGCEAHVLIAADRGIDDGVLRDNRGWSREAWNAAATRLIGRGLLDLDRKLTSQGRDTRREVETKTDTLATAPWAAQPAGTIDELIRNLTPITKTIAERGAIPFPNPMGLPKPVF